MCISLHDHSLPWWLWKTVYPMKRRIPTCLVSGASGKSWLYRRFCSAHVSRRPTPMFLLHFADRRNFKCEICGSAFVQRSILHQHMYNVHLGKLPVFVWGAKIAFFCFRCRGVLRIAHEPPPITPSSNSHGRDKACGH